MEGLVGLFVLKMVAEDSIVLGNEKVPCDCMDLLFCCTVGVYFKGSKKTPEPLAEMKFQPSWH